LLLLEKRNTSAPLSHFNFYLLHLVFISFHFISLSLHRPHDLLNLDTVLTSLHTLSVFTLLTVTLRMPLSSSPSSYVRLPTSDTLPAEAEAEEEDSEAPSMDSKDRVSLPSPEPQVTLFQWVVFSWIGPLIALGKSKKLGFRDVWKLPFEMSSEGIRVTSPGKRFSLSLSLSLSPYRNRAKGTDESYGV